MESNLTSCTFMPTAGVWPFNALSRLLRTVQMLETNESMPTLATVARVRTGNANTFLTIRAITSIQVATPLEDKMAILVSFPKGIVNIVGSPLMSGGRSKGNRSAKNKKIEKLHCGSLGVLLSGEILEVL